MKSIERFFGVISYEKINNTLGTIVSEMETHRNEIRKNALSEMDKLIPSKDGEKIQSLLIQMNRDLTLSYEKETILRDFINKFK